jgi:hypothetical protein
MSIDYKPIEEASPPQKKGLSLRDWLIVTVGLAALIGFAAFMAVRQETQRSAEIGGLQAVVDAFLFAPVEQAPGAAVPRAGKVVLVDVGKRAIDDLHVALPEDVRAQTPDEVTTVAQLRYTRQEVGHFEGGARAIQLKATLTVIDRKTQTVIATRSFTWGKPPTRIPRTGATEDIVGTAPWKEITAFLKGLR